MTLQWRVLALVLGLCTAGCASVESLFPSNNPYDILRLVNRDHKLPYEFVPDVVLPNVPAAPGKEEYVYLREEAARALPRTITLSEKNTKIIKSQNALS